MFWGTHQLGKWVHWLSNQTTIAIIGRCAQYASLTWTFKSWIDPNHRRYLTLLLRLITLEMDSWEIKRFINSVILICLSTEHYTGVFTVVNLLEWCLITFHHSGNLKHLVKLNWVENRSHLSLMKADALRLEAGWNWLKAHWRPQNQTPPTENKTIDSFPPKNLVNIGSRHHYW